MLELATTSVDPLAGSFPFARPAADRLEVILDQGLLDGIAMRDAEALGSLFDRHGATVLGLLSRLLGRRGEAEEVLQEVFLWVWEHADRYDSSRSSVRGWLLVIA